MWQLRGETETEGQGCSHPLLSLQIFTERRRVSDTVCFSVCLAPRSHLIAPWVADE